MGYRTPLIYTVPIHSSSSGHNPADSTNYFMMATPFIHTTAAAAELKINRAGIIRGGALKVYVTTPGTAEAVTALIRINDTTDHAFGTYATNATNASINALGLAIPVAVNDTVVLKISTPAWVTNPFGVLYGGYLLIESY